MSKSLNFVVSIKLDRRSTDVNGNNPIKLRVWNRASKRVKCTVVINFQILQHLKKQ